MVEVPDTEFRIPPAVVRVRPDEEKSPPCPANAVPLEKVLVAVLVWRILPPPMVMPEEVAKSPPMRMPLKIVDVEFTTKFPTSWRERREPGVVVPMPTLPVEDAIVRYVDVPALKLLISPHARFPIVVEANQCTVFKGSVCWAVSINCGEEEALIARAAKGVEVPIPRRGAGPAALGVKILRNPAESRVVAPE